MAGAHSAKAGLTRARRAVRRAGPGEGRGDATGTALLLKIGGMRGGGAAGMLGQWIVSARARDAVVVGGSAYASGQQRTR